MRPALLIPSILLPCALAISQSPAGAPTSVDVFRSASTLVTVPALVRDAAGEFVDHLDAGSFELFDNGTRQAVRLAARELEPIALVVVVQTGGTGVRHFLDYTDLPALLEWLMSATNHELMLAAFDSRVELIWHFPVRSDGVAYSLTHLHAGDGRVAIMDAVQFGVEQLQSEPGNFRRIVLLVSQEKDQGSTTTPEEVLRMLGRGSTAVYSITFSAAKSRSTSKGSRQHEKIVPPGPLAAMVNGLRENTAAELASYTGGAHVTFSNRHDFDESIKAMAADLHNRYTLAFQPTAHEPGLHQLRVKARDGLTVAARGGYWFDPLSAGH